MSTILTTALSAVSVHISTLACTVVSAPTGFIFDKVKYVNSQ